MLKSYDGKNINYDEIGNPEYYMGADLTWTNGRQLKRYVNDDVTVAYTYDDAGMRTSKTVNGVESTYLYLDGKLHGEVRDGHHIHYSYDSYGNLSVIKYYKNDTDYNVFYVMTNVFGDVVSLHNANGTQVASYEYDSWGNVISMTDTTGIGIATINPIRYRGYFYDSETGLYYLSSRYYDPQVGRFINADGYVSTGQGVLSHNMFAYCGNAPIKRADPTGRFYVEVALLKSAETILLAALACLAIWVIPWDSVAQSISKGWSQVKDSVEAASISLSISQSVSKTKSKIRNEKKRYDYWVAIYVDYGQGNGTYIPTTPLTYKKAISYVRNGGSVFADTKNHAYKLAKAVGTSKPVLDPAHGGLGYWKHYHAMRKNKRVGGHIFYVT